MAFAIHLDHDTISFLTRYLGLREREMKTKSVKTFLPARTSQIVGLICGGAIFSGCVLAEKYDAEKARSLNFQRLLAQDERRMNALETEVKRSKQEVAELARQNQELSAEIQSKRQEMISLQGENEALKEENETLKEAANLQQSEQVLASSLREYFTTPYKAEELP
jgi:peptidoglycan hydrolase CwlO-like protein